MFKKRCFTVGRADGSPMYFSPVLTMINENVFKNNFFITLLNWYAKHLHLIGGQDIAAVAVTLLHIVFLHFKYYSI